MPITITRSRMLICEGLADKSFFTHLIRKRGLPEFQIEFPSDQTGGGGWQGYKPLLSGLQVQSDFGGLRGTCSSSQIATGTRTLYGQPCVN